MRGATAARASAPSRIVPGQIETYAIDLWATSNVFKAGHRLRLYVSSSNFPRFDRNLNTGESTADSARMVKAQQAVYHDAAHPSALILPVVPGRERSELMETDVGAPCTAQATLERCFTYSRTTL